MFIIYIFLINESSIQLFFEGRNNPLVSFNILFYSIYKVVTEFEKILHFSGFI